MRKMTKEISFRQLIIPTILGVGFGVLCLKYPLVLNVTTFIAVVAVIFVMYKSSLKK